MSYRAKVDLIRAREEIAYLRSALTGLVAAAQWHIDSNADTVVGRDGRQRITLNMVKADHAVVDQIAASRDVLADLEGKWAELAEEE